MRTDVSPTRDCPAAGKRHASRGFTLIEIMVVVVILTIIMGLAIPRLGNTDHRNFELAVDRVSDLLTMYAQRDNLSPNPVGLLHDTVNRQLKVMALDGNEDGGDWVVDRLVRPVLLPPVVDQDLLSLYVDGEHMDIREWPLGNTPGMDRPTIEIVMQDASGDEQVTLMLASSAMSPRRQWNGGRGRTVLRSAVDLDAQGQSREDW